MSTLRGAGRLGSTSGVLGRSSAHPPEHSGVDAVSMLDGLAGASQGSHAQRAEMLREAAADLEKQVRAVPEGLVACDV